MDDLEEKHDRECDKLERLFKQGILSEDEYLRRFRMLDRQYLNNYLRQKND